MATSPPKSETPAARLDYLIADPVVHMTLKADCIAEQEFLELLRAAGWRIFPIGPPSHRTGGTGGHDRRPAERTRAPAVRVPGSKVTRAAAARWALSG